MIRDKYRIDAFIATGSMANVYAATHRNGSRRISRIEIVSPDPKTSAAHMGRLIDQPVLVLHGQQVAGVDGHLQDPARMELSAPDARTPNGDPTR